MEMDGCADGGYPLLAGLFFPVGMDGNLHLYLA